MNGRSRGLWIGVIVVLLVAGGTVSYLELTPRSRPSGVPSYPGAAACPAASAGSPDGNWTTYHEDLARAGFAPEANVSSVEPAWTHPPNLDGQIYAEPLVCGSSVYVATEGDSVYAIGATNGSILWHTNLGTPVPASALPCGDIDPSGITGTPVIDLAAGTLYVVAFATPGQHVLYGLNLTNGSVTSHEVVDPMGADPLVEQQRGALVLANDYVYVVFGGLYGDCGDYHGWVVGVPMGGSGGLIAYQVPTHREGAIWGVAGAAVAANGDLFVSTGNGDSTTAFDHGDSVIELSPTLSEIGYFAPANWAQLNRGDTDLGSVAPTLLSDGDLFQIGKAGVGYLLDGSNLGGIGGEIANASVCSGAYGGTARVGATVFVPCTDGLVAVIASASTLSIGWRSSSFDAGSPIVTGNVLWSVDLSDAHLRGFNASTGAPLFSLPIGSADHFISPSASPGRLFVGAGSELEAFSLA